MKGKMGFINKKKLGIWAVVLVFLVIIAWQLLKIVTFAEPLSAAEAAEKVKELYKGEIVEVIEGKSSYQFTVKLETGIYSIEIDRETGDISSMTRSNEKKAGNSGEDNGEKIKEQSPSSPEEQTTQETPGQTPLNPVEPTKEPVKVITKEQAAAIALQNISGAVDDIDIEDEDEVTFYLVEIEKEDGNGGTVQINAITGDVMSVTWDD